MTVVINEGFRRAIGERNLGEVALAVVYESGLSSHRIGDGAKEFSRISESCHQAYRIGDGDKPSLGIVAVGCGVPITIQHRDF